MKKYIALVLTAFLLTVSAYAGFSDFSDITQDYSWAAEDISYLSDNGIINGFPDGTFKPDENITNAQTAKIVTLMFGSSEKSASYSDVAEDSWYYDYVKNSDGYFIRDDKFLPDENSTRQEIVYALYKAAKLKKAENTADFSETVDEKYRESVESAYENGIIEGYPDGSLRLSNPVTRAEFAVMAMRAKKLADKVSEKPEKPDEPEKPEEPNKPEQPEKPEKPAKEIKANNYFFVVTEVSTVSENGAALTKVTGMNDGEAEEFTVAEDEIKITDSTGGGTALRKNTVLYVFKDYFGNVKQINIAADFDIPPTEDDFYTKTIQISSKQQYIDCIPDYANDEKNKISLRRRGWVNVAENARAYIYNNDELTLKGSLTRIKSGKDRVFAYLKDDIIQEYIIIRQKN